MATLPSLRRSTMSAMRNCAFSRSRGALRKMKLSAGGNFVVTAVPCEHGTISRWLFCWKTGSAFIATPVLQ